MSKLYYIKKRILQNLKKIKCFSINVRFGKPIEFWNNLKPLTFVIKYSLPYSMVEMAENGVCVWMYGNGDGGRY